MTTRLRLTIRAHLATYTGYNQVINECFKWLTKSGIYVSIRPIAIDEQWGKSSAIPAEMRAQIVNSRQPEEFELLFAPPDNAPTPGRKTIWFTMYESTQMPQQYVNLLNKNGVEQIITPCKWNTKCFTENGVKKPIATIPLGFDPEVFKPSPIATHGPCVFGAAGRTKHCAARKNLQASINLFLKTFPNEDDVRLHVKIHPDDTVESNDHRIKVTRHNFEPYEIAQWLSGLTAYVTLSRGEGYGLWALQSLACGRPVIACAYGGHADFLTDQNAFLVPFREVDAASGESNVEYLGQWAEPNEKAAAKSMREIYANRKVIASIMHQPESVAHLTWGNTTNRLIQVLHDCGVWK